MFRSFFLAVSLLTRLPVPRFSEPGDREWRLSFAFYPLCGWIIAIFSFFPVAALWYGLKGTGIFHTFPFFSGLLFVSAEAWMTRIFHLDGFIDVCDGLVANAGNREERLRVMKDPNVGAAGAVGLVLLLAGKITMCSLIAFCVNDLSELFMYFAALPLFGRISILITAFRSRYPRSEGTGARVVGKVPAWVFIVAILLMLPLRIELYCKFAAAGIAAALVCSIYWRVVAKSRFGGVTGDVLGAASESTELLCAFFFILAMR